MRFNNPAEGRFGWHVHNLSVGCRGVWIMVAAGCSGTTGTGTPPGGDLEGIEETSDGLTDLSNQCSFAASTSTLTFTMNAGGQIAMIAKAPTGNLTVNGFACATATATNTKKILVTGSGGNNTLILDFMGGTYAMGAATQPSGIDVDLTGGAGDALKIRGSVLADNYVAGVGSGGGVVGTGAISINGDAFKDITLISVEALVVALGDGADTFHGRGNAATNNGPYPGAITVYGGKGNDTLGGGAGDDNLNGGDGNDTFTMAAAADGADDYHGNNDTDTVDYSSRPANRPVVVTMDGSNAGDNGGAEADKVELDVENLKGSAGNDTLTGNASANTISGMAGDDVIDGAAGNDTLNGGDGNDTFIESGLNNTAGASGADVFNGGAGTDTIDYSSRTTGVVVNISDAIANDGESNEGDKVMSDVENVIGSATASNTIIGSIADNKLVGGSQADTISGGAGNDLLIGGGGNDTLNGDAGDDTFDEGASANGSDVFNGGAGVDTVTYAGRTNDGECITVTMDGVAANDGQTDTDGVDGAPFVSEGDNVKGDVANLIGSDCTMLLDGVTAAGDTITGNALANTIDGRLGNDTLNGSTGDDTLIGGPGNDTLIGGAGSDQLESGPGNDVLTCGLGDDLAFFDSADTTDSQCELPESHDGSCGDGVALGSEQCDDGGTVGGDGCDATCNIEFGFSCSGSPLDDSPSVCSNTCGDGRKASIESCDDGGTANGDGCSATCTVETGFSCVGNLPSSCAAICGDGLIRGGEQCDDGNTTDGDGCSATCTTEAPQS